MASPENQPTAQLRLFSSPLIDIEYTLGPPAESMEDVVAGGPENMQPKVEQVVPEIPELPVHPMNKASVTIRQRKRGGSKILMPAPAQGTIKKAPAKPKYTTTTGSRKVTAKKENNIDQENESTKIENKAPKNVHTNSKDATGTLPRKTYQARGTATASTSSRSGSTASSASSSKEILICYRCNCAIKGPNASKEMDKHLKDCGLVVCVLCNKKYKTLQTLQIHQRKVHAPKNE